MRQMMDECQWLLYLDGCLPWVLSLSTSGCCHRKPIGQCVMEKVYFGFHLEVRKVQEFYTTVFWTPREGFLLLYNRVEE